MGVLSWLGLGPKHSDFDHGAHELEATLPAEVAGRPLVKWSIGGMEFWKAVGRKPRAGDEAELHALGLSPTDMQMAVAGRADTRVDLPFVVWAVRFGSLTGAALRKPLPSSLAMGVMRVDPTQDADFHERTIANRPVMVGTPKMVRQNQHHRGIPYVYVAHSAIYGVIADDESWVEEAIGLLPAMRDSGQ